MTIAERRAIAERFSQAGAKTMQFYIVIREKEQRFEVIRGVQSIEQ